MSDEKMVEVQERLYAEGVDGIMRLIAIPGDVIAESEFAAAKGDPDAVPAERTKKDIIAEARTRFGVELSANLTKAKLEAALADLEAKNAPTIVEGDMVVLHDAPASDTLEDMSLDELVELASLIEVNAEGLERDELIAAIRAKRG